MIRAGLICLCVVAGAVQAFAADSLPIGVRIMSYGKFQDAAWAHLPSLGVRNIFIPVPAANEADAVMQRLKAAGLSAPVVRGNTDLSKESCVDELAEQLAVCEKLGAKYMFLSAKRNGAEKSVVYDRLRKAGDAAKKHGVIIVLETHPDLGTNGDVHLETMKAVNHPNVRVNFDTGNITFYNSGANAVDELKKVIDYVATVELKDHSCELESWDFPALGKGKVDFPGIIAVLKAHNFSGPITIEFEGVKGVELNEEQTKAAIAESVQYIKSLAAK
jgi:sugar phosphate isomerase/epimerase